MKLSPINPVFLENGRKWCDQITVATAGVSQQGGNNPCPTGIIVEGHPSNSGIIYVWWQGGDGRTHGYALGAGNEMFFPVDNLNKLWFDASANSQIACWLLW